MAGEQGRALGGVSAPGATPRAVGFLAGGAQTFPEGRALAAEACRLWALHTPLVPSRA